MQSLKLHFLCNKIAIRSINSNFHTGSQLLVRRRGPKVFDDPGFRHQKVLHQDDAEFLRQLENEENPDDEEADFMKLDEAYDLHLREKKKEREILRKKITIHRFFSSPKQPAMLTFAEKKTIKFLHEKDPVHWDVKTLSDSFPATPSTINKILKSNWKTSPEKERLKDKNVQKNWELLEKGELDADPDVIEHLKKFINRRQGILDQIQNEQFYLPEKEQKPVWNNGEMNSIITQYERLIEKLQKENEAKLKLNDGKTTDKTPEIRASTKKKSSLDTLHEKIEEKVNVKNLKGKETFTLGKMLNYYRKPMTFEEVQKEVIDKAEADKKLHLSEQAILESKLGVNRYNKGDPAMPSSGFSKSAAPQKSRGSTRSGIELLKLTSKMFEKETTVREIADVEKEYERNTEEEERLRRKLFLSPEEKQITFPPPDKNTILVNESEIGKILNEVKEKNQTFEKQGEEQGKEQVEEQVERKSQQIDNEKDVEESGEVESEREMRERLHYEKLEEDIRNTPFWNNTRTSKEKALAEFEKAPLAEPSNLDKLTKVDVSCHDHYPERIDIPKNQRGSGLTFKVKDCYYDDDGEFLYRVPGMTK